MIKDVYYNYNDLEDMFTCGEEGTNVKVEQGAIDAAAQALGVPNDTAITWNTPDVFDVRYGSSYVATANVGDLAVRFHSVDGDFREGDDK